jgi:Phosphoribosyl transferase (PRTase)/TRSP domain C terminus to PRTase_2/PELOTA RNA binding domain
MGERDGGRHGFAPSDRHRLERAAARCVDELVARPDCLGARVLVLGFEELMYAPLRLATELATRLDGETEVRFSTTTRSPVLAVDDKGYPIRTSLTFAAHDDPVDGPGLRFAYNVSGRAAGFTDIVLVIDDVADTVALHQPGGLLAHLAGETDRLHLIRIPSYRPARSPEPLRGPQFGSYAADEVAWLLTDLSHLELEAPTEEREEAVQSGGAHYAESLPIEYQPDAAYQRLYEQALSESAAKIAQAVGIVTELILAERGRPTVLVSLARAGTPIGILMRRWAQRQHGLELPHYAVSIVRGRGIDTVALRYLAERHAASDIRFVDGWTGKGAITRELAAAVQRANSELGLTAADGFQPELAVLADTGHCVRRFGTRADYLIPSACLNSTVSGLVSRTVLNDSLIGPRDFHGAKFYANLASVDVSNAFLDAVSAHFPGVGAGVEATLAARADGRIDVEPTWTGWASVQAISDRYGIDNVNLVKPGVGETTRVLLRRVPWRVLMRTDKVDELGHISLLAAQRGVEVELVDDLAYSCVGLIHPNFTRGATGADGIAAGART